MDTNCVCGGCEPHRALIAAARDAIVDEPIVDCVKRDTGSGAVAFLRSHVN